MNKVEFSRMLQRISGSKPHILYSRAYEVWFCLGQHCIGQGATESEAFYHWQGIRDAHEAGQRHSAAMQRSLAESQERIARDAFKAERDRYMREHSAINEAEPVLDTAEVLREAHHPLVCQCNKPVGPPCAIAPLGWFCTRQEGHDGPCAAEKHRYSALEDQSCSTKANGGLLMNKHMPLSEPV